MSELLRELRAKYPVYNDWEDEKLVNALHKKYNAKSGLNLSLEDYQSSIGYQPIIQEPVEQQLPEDIDAVTGAAEPVQDLSVAEKITNIAKAAGERAGDVSGALLSGIDIAAKELEEKYPLGGFTWNEGDLFPTYLSGEELAEKQPESVFGNAAETLKSIDLGYKEQKSWQNVKDAFSKDGVFSGSAYADVVEYGLEQGLKSVPDMVGAVFALPAYLLSRSEEIGQERAKNKGKEGAELEDILEASPFAVGSAFLERIGAKGMTSDVVENVGKEMLKDGIKNAAKEIAKEGGKGLGKEAVTEFIQEGMVEYVGERYGTDAKMSFEEGLERGIAGAVAGGVTGGAIATTTATGLAAKEGIKTAEERIAPGRVIGREMEKQLAETEFVTPTEQEARIAMDPEMAQIKATPQEQKTVAMLVKEKLFDKGVELLPPMDKIPTQPEAVLPEPVKEVKKDVELDTVGVPTERDQRKRVEPDQPDIEPTREPGKVVGVAPEGIKPSGKPVEPVAKPITKPVAPLKAKGKEIIETPISEITLSKDVPQFKEGADVKGVVEALGGKFDRVGVAPIQIWVRKDGRKEVITGRHRLDLATRSGEETIPAQYHYESEGFGVEQVAALDAILNIREGQGKVKDYVEFIKATKLTEKEAAAQGILARATGKRAYTIANKGTDALIASHRANVLTDEAAVRIALAAPKNESLQAVGIKAIQDGKTIVVAENLVKAVSSMTGGQEATGDMFGFDDSAMKEAEELAKRAIRKQSEIQRTLSAIQGATKRPDLARKEGIDVKDPEAIKKRIAQLKDEKRKWDTWHTNPELVAELKGEGFELKQETEQERKAREDREKAEAKERDLEDRKKEQKIDADQEVEGFVLEGSDHPVDRAEARGQKPLFMRETKPPKGKKGVTIDVQKQTVFGAEIDINGKTPKKQNVKKDADIFYAPGHNYVGLHRSTGIPPRQDFLFIDGKRIVVPGKVQRIEPIIRTMTGIMGRRIYFGKIKGNGPLGFYRDATGEIRSRKKNDVEVLAHEMAHYLDMYSNKILPNFQKLYKDEKYSDQVMALSYTDSNKKLQQSEGFAEFVRLWLTNANVAKERAPDFYQAFNKTLTRDKRLAKPMKKMQEQMHKFYFQGADKLGQALIGDEGTVAGKLNQWLYRRDSRIRQQAIDRFHAARKIEQELTGKISKTGESAWKQLRVSNGGYEGIADYVLNYGTINFDESGDIVQTGRSLHDVLKPVESIKRKKEHKKDDKIQLLMRYFAGRRALELHMQGRENLLPIESAKTWARLGGDYPVFEGIFREYQQFNSRMMDFYETSGLLTKESRNTIQNLNKDYVPFYRIRETLTTGKAPGGAFHKLKGGTANLNDILVNIQDGITTNVRHALNNKAKERLYQYIQSHKDGAIFATRIAPDSKPVKVYWDDMANKINSVLEDNGIEIEGELDLSDPSLLMFWQHGVKPKVNESGNIVDTVLIDGKPKYYEVQDPLLQEMLLGMNTESYSSFMNVMFGVKNFFTRTITLGVEFTGANLVRDTIGAAFISKHHFRPFYDSFKGMYSFLKKDKYYQAFLKSGGGYSSRIEAQTREGKARRRVAIDEYGVLSLPEKLFTVFDHYSSAFEYGTRIGEFRLAKKYGETNMDAAFAAREISTDFSVLGANRFLTGYIRTVPFLNAMVQSQDRIYREALIKRKYDGHPIRFTMKAVLGITIPSLILYMMNKDDEDYHNIPDHERRTNWHIKTPDGKRFIKIPKPYDVGFVFATMPELFFKYMEDEKGKEFADGMLWTLTQMYGIDGTPAMMTGWWDLVRNEKWTGAPVVPHGLSDVEATEQYNANTSETFIRLGQALGMSPIKAEHAFKAYTGYLGGYLLWGTNQLLWDEDRFGPQPERDVSSNIFLRRFLSPEVRPSTHGMEKFFELKEKSDEVVATFKTRIDIRRAIAKKAEKKDVFKRDRFYGLSEQEKKVLFGLNDSMNKLITDIYGKKGIKTAELAIRFNKNLSAKEKRKKLDNLWIRRNSMFMKYYNAANKALLKAKKAAEKFEQEKN